jgi:sister-chromatid-cohesion protein PDS5
MLLITSILPALSDPSNAYNTQHKYVLVSLAEVKSIVLLTDLPNHEDLLLHIFDNCFDIISGSARSSTGETIAKDVEYNMTQILVTLVDESQSLPGEVVESIMAQFLRVSRPGGHKERKDVDEKQSTLLLKELPEAYNMAKTICNSCPEKMARYVSQYFNDVIMEVTGADSKTNGHRKADAGGDSDDEEAPAGPTEAGLQELHKAHDLLRELWRASPAVLQNVIPQLEAELSAENVGLRLLATETLGDIISGIGAAGPPPPPVMDPAAYPQVKLEDCPQGPVSDSILTTPSSPQSFAQTHATVYNSFMSRHKDKSPVVRAGWTTAIGRIIVTSAGGIGLSRDEEAGLIKGLNEKLTDGDERVRLAAVKVIGGFGFRDIMTRLVPNGHLTKSGSILSSFADRVRDRKHTIRAEAMTALGRMWGVATGEILAGNTTVSESLGAIPTKIFDAFYANDPDLNVLLDLVMFEQLLPLSYPPTKSKKVTNGDSQGHANGAGSFDADKIRTERILLLVKSLDSKSSKAFFAMQARQPLYVKVLEAFLKLCEENNGGVVEKDLDSVKSKLGSCIKWFGDNLPDPFRITQDLNKYVKLHDRRSYQLLRFAMAPENDFNTVHKAIKEFRKRFSAKDSPAGILDTFNPIIYRSSCLIYNISHQPVILQFSRTDDSGLGATANLVMKEISDKHPEIFQASVKELCKAIVDNAPSEAKANAPGSVDTLKALASFAKDGNNKIPSDRKFIQALKDFALYGTPAKVAKYAVSILTTTERKEMHLKDLLDKSVENWTYGSPHFLTKLATLSQLTLLDPKSTEDASDEILDITTAQILLKTQTSKSDDDPEWQADGEVDEECEAKSWALKILVNRLRITTGAETAKKLSVPVFKVLNALIVKNGELSKQNDTPRHHKARLRLLAAQQMLKICTSKMFDDLLSPVEFNRLSFVAQDHLEYVRRGFVEKLQKYIVKGRLSNRFLTIIFLTTFEPSLNFRNSIMTWIRSRVKLCTDTKSGIFEAVFPRLIHLLAHHPDYTDNPEELADNAKYLLYYLTTVSSEANLPHIYKYAERVKQTRDALPGADSDRLYLLSDLAQMLIRKWQEKKGWNLQTWPAKVGMPVGLFAGLPSHEVAQQIAEKNYLPDEMEDLLEDLVRKSESKKVCSRSR